MYKAFFNVDRWYRLVDNNNNSHSQNCFVLGLLIAFSKISIRTKFFLQALAQSCIADLPKFPCCDLYWGADACASINNAAFIEVACDVTGNMALHTEKAKQIQMAQTQVKWQLCEYCGYGCQYVYKHWGTDLCLCYYGDASSFAAMGNFCGPHGNIH